MSRRMRFDGIVLDLEGTLYRGDDVIPGAPQAVTRLRDEGLAVRFLTNTTSSSRWMMRCSVAVKSRPPAGECSRPLPPNMLSITRNTSDGSITNRQWPRSGGIITMLRLVGTSRPPRNWLNLLTRIGPALTSGVRRMKLKIPSRSIRAKRSLMISSVGMRPRTMRSCLPIS